MAAPLLSALLCACTSQARPPSPMTTQQRAELEKLAAGKDSPDGLKEALAGVDAHEIHRTCRDRAAAVAEQMKMLGRVDAAMITAGKIGGRAATQAAKTVAVMHAKTIRTQVSALPQLHG